MALATVTRNATNSPAGSHAAVTLTGCFAARTRSRERPNLMHCRFVCLPSRAGRTLSPFQAGPFAAGWISKQVHCIKARARDQKGLWSSPFSQGLAGAPTGDSFTLFPSTGQKLHLHRRLGRRRRIAFCLLTFAFLTFACGTFGGWIQARSPRGRGSRTTFPLPK